MRRMWTLLAAALAVAAAGDRAAAQVSPYAQSIQDLLIGANTVQAQGVTGAGVTFGVIDTGVAAPWVGFGGRVYGLPVSACLISPSCNQALAVTDDNGHGTFVAGEIIANDPGAGVTGVAPGGAVISVKTLNGAGTGTSNDVANGIIYAVNRGAQVLNLSLTFLPTSTIVNAINYAASRNAVIVFAGGNSAAQFMNGRTVTGFTDQAIQHMIFMGSTNSGLKLSSFSDIPGNGGFLSTSGTFYPFATRWMMADGENIVGASNVPSAQSGYSLLALASGTSMAAPQAAGAIGLLAQRWPFLLTNGTIAQVLLASAQPLGASSIYGEGFLRVDQAFSPIGPLSLYAAGTLQNPAMGQVVASGALGTLANYAAQLKSVALLDSFGRDFQADLSSVVTVKRATPLAAMQSVAATTTTKTMQFAGGSYLSATVTTMLDTAAAASFAEQENNPFAKTTRAWSMALTTGEGGFAGAGYGTGAASAFVDGLMGGPTGLTRTSLFTNAGSAVSTSLLGITEEASYGVAAVTVGPGRLAFAASSAETPGYQVAGWGGAAANATALGYSVKLSEAWRLGMTLAGLAESSELLGTTFSGPFSLAGDSRSVSLGATSSYALDGLLPVRGLTLAFDAVYAATSAGKVADSLVTKTSSLQSMGFGVSLSAERVLDEEDSLALGLSTPLRVYSGSATLVVPTGTDASGNVVTEVRKASLASSGYEKDLDLSYSRPLFWPGLAATVGLQLRSDVDQVPGRYGIRGLVGAKYQF